VENLFSQCLVLINHIKNITMQKIALLFVLSLFSVLLKAQSSEHYLLYDAACVQKFDYERNEGYNDLAFWDYHLKLNDKKTLIFRVLKQEAYMDEIAALDKEPLRCNDEQFLDSNFINDINSSKKSLSIAEYNKEKKNYRMYSVKKVIIHNAIGNGFEMMGDYKLFFNNKTKVGDNVDSSGGRVLYMGAIKIQCFNLHHFRAYDKVQPRFSEEFYYAEQIGLFKISKDPGILDLAYINGVDINEYLKSKCKNSSVDKVKDPIAQKDSFVLDSDGMYSIKSGDNLYKLANFFNTRVDVIMGLNNMKTAELKLGQKLKVKDDGSYKDLNPIMRKDEKSKETLKIHIVRQGEILQDIASKYKVSVQEIMKLNNLKDSKIEIFQELVIEKIKP
jgi:LysM repeat protein